MSQSRRVPPENINADLLAQVAARYETVLSLRLVRVAQRFLSEAPELCAAGGFSEGWSLVQRLAPGVLSRAVRQPLLDAWVTTAERLLSSSIHLRYPHAHPVRHLKDFGRLVLSWAGTAPEGAEGRVHLLGRQTVPLLYGTVLLSFAERLPEAILTWRVEGGMLRLSLGTEDTLAEVDLLTGDSSALGPRWSVVGLPSVGTIIVDVWTTEYAGENPTGARALALQDWLARAMNELGDEHPGGAVVRDFCRCITSVGTAGGWAAGLVRVPKVGPGSASRLLVELACRDYAERSLKVVPLDARLNIAGAGGDPRTLPPELAAQRLRASLFGEEPEGESRALPDEILSRPGAVNVGAGIAREPAGTAGGQITLENAAPESTGRALLSLDEPLRAAGLDVQPGSPLVLRKTRHGDGGPVDWHPIDSLLRFGTDELGRLFEAGRSLATESEAGAYCAAISSYLLGRFDACCEALLLCLAHDRDVEEYWHLMAFSFRHAGAREAFDALIFEDAREVSALTAFLGDVNVSCTPEAS